MKAFLRLLLLTLLALVPPVTAVGQYTGVTATSTPALNVRRPLTTDQAILFPPQRDLLLLPGDLIQVSVFGVLPPYLDVERVALDGTVRLPLAGAVAVAGLSVSEAESRLSRFFEERQLFHDAQVSVLITESTNHVVTLTGVMKGQIPIIGQRTLLDVLALGGGLPPNASTVIQIDRPGLPEPILVNIGNDPSKTLAANIPIFSGDLITTGDVGQYFVVGAVANGGGRPLPGARPVTVLQALVANGGTTPTAKRSETRLVHTVGNTRTIVHLDLARIERGQDPDPVLQADDILVVPSSAWKAFFRVTSATSLIAIAVSLSTILTR